jgi:hypothetical protein
MFARRSVVSACQKYPPSLPPTAPAAAPADSPPSASAQSASENVVSTVISHVPAISCIHVPTAETALAIHWSRNSGILSGANPLTAGAVSNHGPASGVSRGVAHLVSGFNTHRKSQRNPHRKPKRNEAPRSLFYQPYPFDHGYALNQASQRTRPDKKAA